MNGTQADITESFHFLSTSEAAISPSPRYSYKHEVMEYLKQLGGFDTGFNITALLNNPVFLKRNSTNKWKPLMESES